MSVGSVNSLPPAGTDAPAVSATPSPQPAAPVISRPRSGGWWTIPLLSIGICLIACPMIIGQVEENRQLAWQRNKMQVYMDHFQQQLDLNQQFVDRLEKDPNLAERLAQRQMKMVRPGAAVLELNDGKSSEDTSPFRLVNIPPPPVLKPYQPAHGVLSILFGNARVRLYTYGLGAFLIAVGLIMGGSDGKTAKE